MLLLYLGNSSVTAPGIADAYAVGGLLLVAVDTYQRICSEYGQSSGSRRLGLAVSIWPRLPLELPP